MGPTGEMMITYRATNALLTNSGCGAVLTVTGDDVKSVQGVPKKTHFQNCVGYQINQK